MTKSIIGGFTVKELPAETKKLDEIAKCWNCGTYSTQSKMNVSGSRYYCDICFHGKWDNEK